MEANKIHFLWFFIIGISNLDKKGIGFVQVIWNITSYEGLRADYNLIMEFFSDLTWERIPHVSPWKAVIIQVIYKDES